MNQSEFTEKNLRSPFKRARPITPPKTQSGRPTLHTQKLCATQRSKTSGYPCPYVFRQVLECGAACRFSLKFQLSAPSSTRLRFLSGVGKAVSDTAP